MKIDIFEPIIIFDLGLLYEWDMNLPKKIKVSFVNVQFGTKKHHISGPFTLPPGLETWLYHESNNLLEQHCLKPDDQSVHIKYQQLFARLNSFYEWTESKLGMISSGCRISELIPINKRSYHHRSWLICWWTFSKTQSNRFQLNAIKKKTTPFFAKPLHYGLVIEFINKNPRKI